MSRIELLMRELSLDETSIQDVLLKVELAGTISLGINRDLILLGNGNADA